MDGNQRIRKKRIYRVVLDESTNINIPKVLKYQNIEQEWNEIIVPIILDFHKTMDKMTNSIDSLFGKYSFIFLLCFPCCVKSKAIIKNGFDINQDFLDRMEERCNSFKSDSLQKKINFKTGHKTEKVYVRNSTDFLHTIYYIDIEY